LGKLASDPPAAAVAVRPETGYWFVHATFLGCILVLLPLASLDRAGEPVPPANHAAKKELPEGRGLAAAFVADAKAQTHPDVIFADDFEAGKLGERWDETSDKNGKVLRLVEPGAAELGRRCMRVEAHLGQDTGGGVTKWFEPADSVFIRFYTKFDAAAIMCTTS